MAHWPGSQLLDIEQFRLVCPEFGSTDKALIVQTLNEAAEELDPCVWGDMLAAGHKYLTAHKLALSPEGANVRLILPSGGKTTTYDTHFQALVRKLPIGIGVAGWPSSCGGWGCY